MNEVDRIVVSKMEVHGETANITRSLTILKDFGWFANAFGHRVPKFAEFPEKI